MSLIYNTGKVTRLLDNGTAIEVKIRRSGDGAALILDVAANQRVIIDALREARMSGNEIGIRHTEMGLLVATVDLEAVEAA